MKNHTKVYLKGMGFTTTDFIPCEVCDQRAVDIHHITPRGMGGSKHRDTLDNLMALCRTCHAIADFGVDLPQAYLRELHATKLLNQ